MSNLVQRILSAAVLIPLVLALIFLAPRWLFSGFIAALAALVGYEYGTVTLAQSFRAHRILVALLAAVCALAVGGFARFPQAVLIAVVAVIVLVPLVFMFSDRDVRESVPSAASACSGALYSGVLTGCLALLHEQPSGRAQVFALFAAAVLSDTGAYAAGRALGRRKLFPRISPAKTWAGACGGVLGTLAGLSLSKWWLLPDLTWTALLALGIPLSLAFQLGDLSESFLKRGFGVKDSGRIIPGHGGILDRIDALLFGAPVLLLFSMLQ